MGVPLVAVRVLTLVPSHLSLSLSLSHLPLPPTPACTQLHPNTLSTLSQTPQASKMPRHYYEFPNDVLLSAAIMGDQEAREERLIREIMVVDGLDWNAAHIKFQAVVETNREGLFMATMPYRIGIGTALAMGFGSVPMIFQLDTALWFNEVRAPAPRSLPSFASLHFILFVCLCLFMLCYVSSVCVCVSVIVTKSTN